jgi:hypothetical protein
MELLATTPPPSFSAAKPVSVCAAASRSGLDLRGRVQIRVGRRGPGTTTEAGGIGALTSTADPPDLHCGAPYAAATAPDGRHQRGGRQAAAAPVAEEGARVCPVGRTPWRMWHGHHRDASGPARRTAYTTAICATMN